uniref:Ubiquitin associated and SH3 domain containing Bb n=1 Tax=Electrophorus electricus TaxID=8005 RepID=A0A4W4GF65_ELEEL
RALYTLPVPLFHMAAKEDLYSKIIPRRFRQNRSIVVKHGSNLEVLLSMGFPKNRAFKALVSTGGRSVQLACDWLFSHVDDPFLDDPLPREYVLYLRPSGPLQNQLSHFWQQSRLICGKNKAHNIFPHITLCKFFMCADSKVEALCGALQSTVSQWRGRFPSLLPLQLYTSANFIGLFIEEQVAETLKKFAADFAVEASSKADVHVEPHKKQLHVTLAYQFPSSHLASLEKLAKGIEAKLGCDWLAVLFSRDIRFANHETVKVMYPYVPQNDDELDLVPGDFVFTSPLEQLSTSEGWVFGTSMGTGLSGMLPENYVSRADECDTWVFHANKENKTLDGLLNFPCLDNSRSGESTIMSVVCQSMQVLRVTRVSPERTLFVCRHGERMDVVFGKHWLSQCSDAKGRYVRSNLNMPPFLPAWAGGHRDYDMDAPITVVGATQARTVGEATLLLTSFTVPRAFAVFRQPTRCSEACMQQDGKLRIRVEPGLFEWTKWLSGSSLPAWIPTTDLAAANLSVDTTYRPRIPVSKLNVSESYDTYMTRSYKVTKDILAECKNKGNNVLIVGHASSLEACTRQLQGLPLHNSKEFVQVVRKIPYLGLCACEEQDTGVWQLVAPPVCPLTHGPNHSFSWRDSLQQE